MDKNNTNQKYRRDGSNIHTTVTVSFVDAILGAKLPLKTLTQSILLVIPAGTQPDTVLRLKGQGIVLDKKSGDLFVTVKVEIPKELSEHQKHLLEQWGR